jgi:DNA end-binding protein Ku
MARSIWSGNISFGLVNVPVKLFTAVRDQSVHFHMLSEDGRCRLRRKLYCPDTGEEYDFKHTARGYEIAPSQYVIIRDEELDKLRPEKGRTIEISDFVDLQDIDPIYYDRTYYLMPDAQGVKGYQLLLHAMRASGKVGIATFVMRRKEYLAALRPTEKAILLETMHFSEEISQIGEEIDEPPKASLAKKELDVAEQLITALSGRFDPSKYEDAYTQKVRELVEAKAEGEEDLVLAEAGEPEAPPVYNLMEALEKSLQQTRRKPSGRGKAPRRKSA